MPRLHRLARSDRSNWPIRPADEIYNAKTKRFIGLKPASGFSGSSCISLTDTSASEEQRILLFFGGPVSHIRPVLSGSASHKHQPVPFRWEWARQRITLRISIQNVPIIVTITIRSQ